MSPWRNVWMAQCPFAAVPAQYGLVLALRGNVSDDADDDPLRNRWNGVEN
jgi:hypothetical protein